MHTSILNQELVLMRFEPQDLIQYLRIQIDELCRLYRVKLNMMEDSPWERFGFQPKLHRNSAFMQKPVDLQLSADEFISHYDGNCLGKEPLAVSLKNFMSSKDFSWGITVSDVDNVNISLGLSIEQSKAKDNRSSVRNKSCASFSQVIDLENHNRSHELPSRFNAAKCSSKDKHMLESFLQIGMNHIPYQSPARETVSASVGPSCQRPPASFSGCVRYHREFLSANLFSKNQTSGTFKPMNPDLNMVQFEYSACLSNSFSMVQNPSSTIFSGVTEAVHMKCANTSSSSLTWLNKANTVGLSESSDKHKKLDLNTDLTNSCGENNEGGWNKGGICVIDLDSDSDSGEPCSSNKSTPKIESVDSSSKFLNNLASKSDYVDAEPHAPNHMNSPKLTSSSGSDHMNNDDQSNNLKTMQPSTKCEDLNFCCSDEIRESSENTESNIRFMKNKKQEADEMAEKAAESLVKISSETRVCHQQLLDKDNQPQCSSDSYEKMVLWAKESDLDDFCVSSNAFVVDESHNKVSNHKLKRGSRMKDFRKDVLPSLSILSRHEIKEDINTMEGVIRSREYKRMRAKIQDDGEWFRAGRSKRSRAGYNRRYHR